MPWFKAFKTLKVVEGDLRLAPNSWCGLFRPPVKRGARIIQKTPQWVGPCKQLLTALGLIVHDVSSFYLNWKYLWFDSSYAQAPGEAEAELGRLNSAGIIDAVLTADADIFMFGAQCVFRLCVKLCVRLKALVAKHFYTVTQDTPFPESNF